MKKIMLSAFSLLCLSSIALGQTAYTLIVGMVSVDEHAYKLKYGKAYDSQGTIGVMKDVGTIKRIIQPFNHQIVQLISETATAKAILNAISDIGKKIRPYDQFTFYYAGHGDFIPDTSGDEASHFDQVLVAYDDFIVDDQIDILLNKYFRYSHNIMIVDACHSGSSYKMNSFFFDLKKKVNAQPLYLNEKKALKQQESLRNCIFDITVDEPYSLVYLGATPDEELSIGNANGGLLTFSMGNIYRRAKENSTWNRYTFRKLACELMEEMGKSKQLLQYHEIGKGSATYAQKLPFKQTY